MKLHYPPENYCWLKSSLEGNACDLSEYMHSRCCCPRMEVVFRHLWEFCTGRSTGQAYVQFATAELANKALDRNRWESHIISLNFDGFESLSVLLRALLKKLC
jgi:hypothetical protein